MPNLKSAICDPLLYTDVLGGFLPAFFPHITEAIKPDGSKIVFKSPKFHHEIIDCLKEQHPKTVIISSRGSSKCGDFSLITPSGDVHVRDIMVGADVLSLEDSGKIGLRKVIAKEYSGQKECWKLTTRSGKEIVCTEDHRLLTQAGYKKLKDISILDLVITSGNVPPCFGGKVFHENIASIENVGFRDTWDVQIEGTENFVSSDGIVSHNSTLITFLWVLYCSCYGMSAFTIIVSDSFKKACNFLDRIKREITDNKFLSDTFEIEPGVPWSQGELVLKLGWLGGKRIRLLARGAGQSLRGYVDNVRPQMIVLDDIEEENNTATPEKRAKIRDWLFGQVLPSLDPVNGRLVFVGTIVHEDAMLARLYKDPPVGWVVKKYSILNEAGESIWPERFPVEKIMQIKEEYARSGTLMRFMMEYMNNPAAAEFRVFEKEHIRYYNPFSLTGDLRHYMAVDFGYAVEGDSDFTVVMVGGIDDASNIYVREYIRRRMKPNETLQIITELYNKYNCNAVGIETNGPQKVYYYMLDEHVKSFALHNVRIIELNHLIKKEHRIMNLQPKFYEGKVFMPPDMHELESELLKFTPNGRSAGHDDTIDTLSNLVMTMNKVNATSPRKKYNPLDFSNYDQMPTHTVYLP